LKFHHDIRTIEIIVPRLFSFEGIFGPSFLGKGI